MSNNALNAICPYYTMYPLDFPLRFLKTHGKRGDWVIERDGRLHPRLGARIDPPRRAGKARFVEMHVDPQRARSSVLSASTVLR
jgi:hypothetical protein